MTNQVSRLGVTLFDAFGHPFIKWPTATNFLVIFIAVIPGFVAALMISDRKAKTI